MSELPIFRINLLRCGYALIAIGLSVQVWSQLINPAAHWELQRSVVMAMLAAMGLLALLGLRYPLRMLPLLLFEVAWKLIWTARMAFPAYLSGHLDAAMMAIVLACAAVVPVIAVMPWDYIVQRYLLARGEPWRTPGMKAARPAE
ncbi:MAG TPA: hypothetical protein VHA07_12255 [Devosia sp.]|nr:hypothetical protein [Devosia sp.]